MHRIRVAIALERSAKAAEASLAAYFEAYREPSGGARIRLRLPLDDFGIPGQLELSRAVIVHVQRQRDEQNLNDEYGIRWEPEGAGPFPEFSGHLTIWSEDDPERSFLEIEGTYEPPLGPVIGEAFDAAIGRLIAMRTAKALLEDVRAGIERPRENI